MTSHRAAFRIRTLFGLSSFGSFFSSSSSASSTVRQRFASNLALDPEAFRSFKLKEILPASKDTSIFRFAAPEGSKIHLSTASYILARTPKLPEGKQVTRPYSPISKETTSDHFDLLVKKYPNGPMSSHIHSLKPGNSLEVKGPGIKLKYEQNMFNKIGMLAGGTGIAPMLQFLQKILDNPNDRTKISLIFGNVSEKDVLLKGKLDQLQEQHPDRLQITYTIDKSTTKDWSHEVGYVNEKMIRKYLPKPDEENIRVFVCGPKPMMDSISGPKGPNFTQGELVGVLKTMGYKPEQVFKI